MYVLLTPVRALVARFGLPMLVGGVVVIGVVMWFTLGGQGSSEKELLTVQPSQFIQEVSVSGKVIPAEDVDLGFAQGGRVARVYVKVGQSVSAGQTLAETENGDLRASVLQRQASLENQEAKLRALQSGSRPEEIAVAESTIQSDQASLEQANVAILEAIREGFTTSDDAIHNKLDQFLSNPRTNFPKLNFQTADQQLSVDIENLRPQIEDRLTRWQRTADGLSPTGDLTQSITAAQSDLSAITGLLTKASAALTVAIPTPSVPRATLDLYSADIATARRNVDSAISALTNAVTSQKSAKAALDSAVKNLALKKAPSSAADIDAQAAQVKAAEADLASARAQLEKTVIRAPFSGVVSKMGLKAGGIASANSTDISLSSNGRYQVESFVPEVNVAAIAIGDQGEVTLDAYGEEEMFAVRIVSIEPSETERDGVSTYRTKLEFLALDERVRSGMTANVVITTDKREDIIAIPVGLVREKNGSRVVSVRIGEKTVDREVVTGAVSSRGEIEIISGLRAGDVLELP